MESKSHKKVSLDEGNVTNDHLVFNYSIVFFIIFGCVMLLVSLSFQEEYNEVGQIFANNMVAKNYTSLVREADLVCLDQAELCTELRQTSDIRDQLIAIENRNSQIASVKYTEGILKISIWQWYFNCLGLFLIFVAVVQTRQMLREARAATKAASDTLISTLNSERPFVYFELETEYENGKKGTLYVGNKKIVVTPVFRNYGRTPAVELEYHIRIAATDPDTNNATQGGNGPSSYFTNLAPNQSTALQSFPPFSSGEYYEYSDRHYVVIAKFSFSDHLGNLVGSEQEVYIKVWPTMPGDGTICDIATKKISAERFAELEAKEKNTHSFDLLRSLSLF